ncbi:galanin peptides isoform X2 [Rhinichthys klamathensis goyatoka]|uniref:galanin peptides isoform X2 n=1 Tax=Rhinichthys klamathensis goyatoka TaxID=3034132 RepID=UPI0024B5C645|nr:galanin peptides isoform X2 [Rhinichthys klamathensis goyatoka]
MNRCVAGVCASLIVCAFFSETLGMVIAAKEKRGWTLNSAGYLLGPHAIDSHRSLSDKHGLAGKREMPIEEYFKTGALRISDEEVVHTIIDFLSYLRLKEIGGLDSLPSSFTSEEISQP